MQAVNARALWLAVCASLGVHAIFATFVHVHPVSAQPEQRVQPIVIRSFKPPKPTPTPPPPKAQPPRPRAATHRVRPAIRIPHVTPNHNVKPNHLAIGPVTNGTPAPFDTFAPPGPAVTAAPLAPTPTPKPACTAPDVPAKAIDAISPAAPDDLADVGSAKAQIRVDLDALGHVTGTSVYTSTGYPELDQAALRAARESTYAAEEKDCRTISGSYLFTVEFQE